MERRRAYRLSLLTFDSQGTLRYWPDGELQIGAGGDILFAGPYGGGKTAEDWRGLLAIPGLIDAHCHLSQYPAVALDGLELLPWLKEHIFPLESSFRGPSVRPKARRFFKDMAAHGTTCAAIYTAIWEDSTDACFEEAMASGMRVILGKVMMDRSSYDRAFAAKHPGVSRCQVSLKESEELCRKWHGRDGGRLLYAFTPRFALSCSMKLMRGAAELAAQYGAYVQTHLAENLDEVRAVRRAFPGCGSYAEVYAKAGILESRAILAHSIWLKDGEERLLERFKPAVVHCPTSNAFLASGIMDLGRMREGGVPLALGSDVAAGPSLCLFSAMRQAIFAQRLAKAHRLFKARLETTPEDVFYMATLGGARALRLAEVTGSLEKGKEADFTVIDPAAYDPGFSAPASASAALSRLVYRAERSAVRATFVRGRCVWDAGEVPSSKTAVRSPK